MFQNLCLIHDFSFFFLLRVEWRVLSLFLWLATFNIAKQEISTCWFFLKIKYLKMFSWDISIETLLIFYLINSYVNLKTNARLESMLNYKCATICRVILTSPKTFFFEYMLTGIITWIWHGPLGVRALWKKFLMPQIFHNFIYISINKNHNF